MPNFSIALTGLQADSVALNTIGNNLANLNTGAFKEQTTTFQDLFYQTIGSSGSGDPVQVGVGTRVSGTATNYTQGSLTTTTNSTDMALSGNGFFLVQNGNDQLLTRAGNFQVSNVGNLETVDGNFVMGYGMTGGVVNLNGGLIPLQLPVGLSEPAQATQNISLTTTLNAASPIGAQFSSPVTLYDSLGEAHVSTVSFAKTSNSTWTYSVALPAGDATGTAVNNTGTLSFDQSGNLVSPAANVTGVKFPGMVDGAKDLTFNLNLYGKSGSPLITQTAGTSNTSTTIQDGYAAGAYQGFTVDSNGVISASFSNGLTQSVGQVAVAEVADQSGLSRAGANNYVATNASGTIAVGAANVGGRGRIQDEALEQSNVDISAEFSNLIVAQRAFEANAKTVTTFDSVTQQAIAMIR